MKTALKPLLALAIIFSLSTFINAQNDRGRELFEEVDTRRNQIAYETTSMKMVIYDAKGRTRTREITSYNFTEGAIERSLLFFEKPGNVAGTGFLTLTEGKDEVQKLYLPALGKIQTITASQKGDRFMGSDFTYEDLGDQNPDDFEFELVSEEGNMATIRATKSEESKYAYQIFYVNTDTYILEKAEYFNDRDDMIKRLEASDHIEVEDGIWRSNNMIMFDLKSGRKTELSWSNRKINEEIPSWRFTERALLRGSR